MSRTLYMAVTGCTGIESISSAGGDFNGPCQLAVVRCTGTTLDVGDAVQVDMGFTDDHAVIVHGYCKEINPTVPDGTIELRIYDDLILAADYLVVSDDPNNPLTFNNIQAEDLVESVLNEASLTNFSGDHPGFTFGVIHPVRVQLIKAWDFVRQVCEMIAWWCYCDQNGQIHFIDRKPYPVGGDVSIHTFATGTGNDLVLVNHTRSDEKTRNKVVVYGYDGLSAKSQGDAPPGVNFPAGFYKAAVISYPDIIDTQEMAQATADYNLTLLNRLTETLTIDVIGSPDLVRGSIVTMPDVEGMDLNGDWFIFEATHRITPSDGYRIHLTLSR